MGVLSKFVGASVGAASLLVLTYLMRRSTTGRRYSPPEKGLWWRPLGEGNEQFHYDCSRISNWNIANVQTLVSKEPIKVDAIKMALLQVARHHPLLRSCVVKFNDSLILQEIPDFDVEVYDSDDSDWLPIFEKYLLDVYRDGSPLWKVALFRKIPPKYSDVKFPYECTLALGFNHTIIDGTGAVHLIREILICLEQNLCGNTNSSLEKISFTCDLPIEDTVPGMQKTSSEVIMGHILRIPAKIPFIVNYLESRLTSFNNPNNWLKKFGVEKQRNSSAECKTTILPQQLTEKETSQILAACKAHGVTVHTVLQTATCIAVAMLLQDGALTNPQEVAFGVPFSMRRFISETFNRNMIGCYYDVYASSTTVEVDWASQFWDYVKQEQFKTKNFIDQFCSSGAGIVRLSYKFQPFKGTKLEFCNLFKGEKRMAHMLSMSNMGLCDFVNKDLHTVQLAARYSASAEHIIGPIFTNTLCTVRGRLFWGIVYYPHIISKERAQTVWDTIMKVLKMTVLV